MAKPQTEIRKLQSQINLFSLISSLAFIAVGIGLYVRFETPAAGFPLWLQEPRVVNLLFIIGVPVAFLCQLWSTILTMRKKQLLRERKGQQGR